MVSVPALTIGRNARSPSARFRPSRSLPSRAIERRPSVATRAALARRSLRRSRRLYDSRRDGPPGSPPIAACPSGSEAHHEEAPTPHAINSPKQLVGALCPRHQAKPAGVKCPSFTDPPQRPALRTLPFGEKAPRAWPAQPRRPWALRSETRAILNFKPRPRRIRP